MSNLFKNVHMKEWHDFVLVVAGSVLLMSVGAIYAGSDLAKGVSLCSAGAFVFGLAAKSAHYKYRDPNVPGNINAYFSGWRHSVWSNGIALIGVAIFAIGCWHLVTA